MEQTEEIPTSIRVHFIALRAAVKLESKGMTRSRRPSARTIAIKELNLPRMSSYAEIIDAISIKLGEKVYCPHCKYNLQYCRCKNG